MEVRGVESLHDHGEDARAVFRWTPPQLLGPVAEAGVGASRSAMRPCEDQCQRGDTEQGPEPAVAGLVEREVGMIAGRFASASSSGAATLTPASALGTRPNAVRAVNRHRPRGRDREDGTVAAPTTRELLQRRTRVGDDTEALDGVDVAVAKRVEERRRWPSVSTVAPDLPTRPRRFGRRSSREVRHRVGVRRVKDVEVVPAVAAADHLGAQVDEPPMPRARSGSDPRNATCRDEISVTSRTSGSGPPTGDRIAGSSSRSGPRASVADRDLAGHLSSATSSGGGERLLVGIADAELSALVDGVVRCLSSPSPPLGSHGRAARTSWSRTSPRLRLEQLGDLVDAHGHLGEVGEHLAGVVVRPAQP